MTARDLMVGDKVGKIDSGRDESVWNGRDRVGRYGMGRERTEWERMGSRVRDRMNHEQSMASLIPVSWNAIIYLNKLPG